MDMNNTIQLFHTGFQIIEVPDIRIGRSNADFGQGFYLSDNEEFSKRWAKERKGCITYLNRYELNLADLKVKIFSKDEEWFEYIFKNRAGYVDSLKEYDVIIGPIANDTIYDTFGMITSGMLDSQEALKILSIGHTYKQVVIKSDKAVQALQFVDAVEISKEEIESYQKNVEVEEAHFQKEFALILEELQ